MEEKQKNKQKPEFKGNLGFIWLIGVLVILLGCTVVYTLKITKENKELKQTPTTLESQQQATTGNEKVSISEEKYSDNLTDSQNGKLAFIELESKGELQTEKHDEYYTYIDPFDKKYNIKEIKDVVSEKGVMGTDNWAALFKVTVTYVDNNDKTKTMVLAIILEPNYEVQNMGTYENYTETTSFVRSFGEYEESSLNDDEKDSIEVTGLNNKFTELSKAAVKGYSTKSVKTIKYDLNNDGKEEKIQLKKSGNDGYDQACVDMYYQNKKIDKEIYIGYEEAIQDSNLYIVDLDKNDNLLDVIIAGFEDNNGFLYLNIYKNTGNTLKRINYKSDKTVSANGGENDNWIGRFYINSNNEFFELSNVEVCFDKVVTYKYYKIENNKAVSKKANIDKIKKETFKVLTDKEMIFYIDHKKFNYDKDYKNHKTFKNGNKVNILEWIDGNEIKAELNGKTIYIMPAHGYLAG